MLIWCVSLATLANPKIFGKLNLVKAYQQMPMDDTITEVQIINTHRGAFKVKCLQSTISIAPGIFPGPHGHSA